MNRYAFAAGAAALSLSLAACGSSQTTTPAPGASSTSSSSSSSSSSDTSSPTSSDTAAAGAAGVVIKEFKFGGTMSVKAGEKVTVTNQDTAGHTMTSKTKGGEFDTGPIPPSGTGTFTAPAKAGSYDVICKFHPRMAGKLTVT